MCVIVSLLMPVAGICPAISGVPSSENTPERGERERGRGREEGRTEFVFLPSGLGQKGHLSMESPANLCGMG